MAKIETPEDALDFLSSGAAKALGFSVEVVGITLGYTVKLNDIVGMSQKPGDEHVFVISGLGSHFPVRYQQLAVELLKILKIKRQVLKTRLEEFLSITRTSDALYSGSCYIHREETERNLQEIDNLIGEKPVKAGMWTE